MLYKEIISSLFYSEIYTKHVKTFLGKMPILLILRQVVHAVTAGPRRVNYKGPVMYFLRLLLNVFFFFCRVVVGT